MRRLIALIFFLLLGIAISMAVAVQFNNSTLSDAKGRRVLDAEIALQLWRRYVDRNPPQPARIEAQKVNSPGLTAINLRYFADDSQDQDHCDILRWGWPFPCMEGELHRSVRAGIIVRPYARSMALIDGPPLSWLGWKRMPTKILWAPLALNMLFYGIGCWLIAMTLNRLGISIRQRIRIARGRCGSCGYELQTSDEAGAKGAMKCPECGSRARHDHRGTVQASAALRWFRTRQRG